MPKAKFYETRRVISLSFSDAHLEAFDKMASELGMTKSRLLALMIEERLGVEKLGRAE